MSAETPADATLRWKPRFFSIWAGQAFSLLGSMLVQFALVWWLTQTTGSAAVLATATLVAVLPGVLLGPVAGTLVDRWNRRAVLIAADSAIAAATLTLILLYRAGALEVWQVYACMAFRALMGAFHWPAMHASTSLMAPESQLTRVSGLNQTLHGAMNIVSPPLGALLLAALPLDKVLAVDILTAALAVTPLLVFTVPQPDRRVESEGTGRPSMWADLRAGLRYVYGWPGLLGVLVVAMIINFVSVPAFSLMPILVTQHFGGGAIQLGWLESSWGLGVVAGGLLLSAWGGFHRKVLTSLTGVIAAGIGITVVGLLPTGLFPVAAGAFLFIGVTNPIINGPFFALLQSRVEADMQGRVMSLTGSATAAMMPLSLLVAGPVADAVGVRAWYVFGGVVTVIVGLASLAVPAILAIEENGHPRPASRVGSATKSNNEDHAFHPSYEEA
jgi:DHA3 family macrolide efflux protein-like MFS transporter